MKELDQITTDLNIQRMLDKAHREYEEAKKLGSPHSFTRWMCLRYHMCDCDRCDFFDCVDCTNESKPL